MQIRIFTIPIDDDGSGVGELNRFLRGHRILAVEREFVMAGGRSCWCFCVRYLASGSAEGLQADRARRVDYREILEPAIFAKFAELRAKRKSIAEAEGIPAYAIFTDEQLAEIAKLSELTPAALAGIKGVGAGRIERYAARLLSLGEVATPPEKDAAAASASVSTTDSKQARP